MYSDLLHIKETAYGGRGLFATTSIPKNAFIYTCSSPYASVIYRVFRKEVCGHCFSYAFDSNRNAWNIRRDGAGVWFCSVECRDAWQDGDGLLGKIHAAVDRLTRSLKGEAKESCSMKKITSKKDLDAAWAASTFDLEPLTQLELDTVRFLASVITVRYTGGGEWADFIQLQDNELEYIRGRPQDLDSQMRVYAFLRKAAQAVPDFYACVTVDTVRAILGRDQGNAFGLYDMSTSGDSEMLGFAMYIKASYFNHDCFPNVRKQREGRSMHFYATRDIEAGEELCISYIDASDPVEKRREELARDWYFTCLCRRCENEPDVKCIS
ncbi:hypothetical protein F5146DRAFT_1034215 [Armillaria mellea]|nr:hypothetical protein F5146DRAFT_1034215 [Armillaria mellea]